MTRLSEVLVFITIFVRQMFFTFWYLPALRLMKSLFFTRLDIVEEMKEEYKQYGQKDYYWILEFLDSHYERSSYKKNGADLVLKMNDAKDIHELLATRKEVSQFITNNNIRFLHDEVRQCTLTPNRIDKYVNRCFNGNIVRLIEELPNDDGSIGTALELYVNSYYVDPTSDERILHTLRNKFGNAIANKLANLEGVKTKYCDCLNRQSDYPEGSNGKKRLLDKYYKLQKELKRYGYVTHDYDIKDTRLFDKIFMTIFIAILVIFLLFILYIIVMLQDFLVIAALILFVGWALAKFVAGG